LVFYSLLSSLILSNLKHELLNRLRSTMAANVLRVLCFIYNNMKTKKMLNNLTVIAICLAKQYV
jgi:hypothetical protein